MIPPLTGRPHRIVLLASANADWLHRLARLASALPGAPVAVVAGRDRAQVPDISALSPVILAVQIRDGGAPLPSPLGIHGGGEQWLIQPDPLADREAAFALGYDEVFAAGIGDHELSHRLERALRSDGMAMLVDGIEGLSQVYARELAGPVHFMGLGQRAMQQEIETLKPLFADLHKAWFESNAALLERLRMILSVINLHDSWNNLSRSLADFGDGLMRLRETQYLLGLSAQLDGPAGTRLSVWEMVAGCLRFLSESSGAGIRFTNRIPQGQGGYLPAPFFFTALLSLFSHILTAMAGQGNGRGSIEITGLSGEMAGRLVIMVRADAPEVEDWMPDYLTEMALFGRIGVKLSSAGRVRGFDLVLNLPLDAEREGP